MNFEDVIDRLNRPDVSIEQLLEECQSPDLELWRQHPELYTMFVDRLLRRGFPAQALDLAREGMQHLKSDSRLQYQLALASARGGNSHYAEELLAPLLAKVAGPPPLPADVDTNLQVDIIALQGRVLKDRSHGNPELARKSAEWYETAAAVPGAENLADAGTFPLINAATMWRVAGELDKSRSHASEVVRRIESRAEAALAADDLWSAATLGEALLLLGRHDEATEWYRRAVTVAVKLQEFGALITIRKQLQLLRKYGATADPQFIDEHLGAVVVFTGHMVDSPDRLGAGKPPRFPNDPALIAAVSEAIRAKLQALNVRVGYCSLASGGDILFAEAALDRGAELHAVLPFAPHDFQRTSVDFGQHSKHWRDWRRRFDDVVDRLESTPGSGLRYATSEPYLGSDELFKFTNKMLQGLAVLRSRECASIPTVVALFDESTSDPDTGTADFLAQWTTAGSETKCHIIDLAKLRQAQLPPPAPKEDVAAPILGDKMSRPVKAMLFADVAGFSKIREWQQYPYRTAYADYLRNLFRSPFGKTAIYANTWGDALHVVFDNVANAARFACELLEPTVAEPPNWEEYGLGKITPFRVGLHTGPVFELTDLFQGRSEFAGQHVTRAARIEPATLRGCAYASEQFAAHLVMEAGNEFLIEGVGQHSLAKGYDRCALYRVQLAGP
jgi:hypothetical protein